MKGEKVHIKRYIRCTLESTVPVTHTKKVHFGAVVFWKWINVNANLQSSNLAIFKASKWSRYIFLELYVDIFLQGGPVEILPFLFLGSAFHASKKDMLDGMGISALLNVSSNCPNHFEGAYQYKCIPVEDNHKEDISSWFIEAIDFIGELSDF